MSIADEGGYDQRVLMAGDSRLKRLRNLPCNEIPLHAIDFIIENGIQIEDLITRVDEVLTQEHATLVLVAFLGDVTCIKKHQLTESSTVTIVDSQPGHPATNVLELAAVAHNRWQKSRPDRKIIWTLPYFIDILTYNSFRLQAPLAPELREQSVQCNQHFVHYIRQLVSKWATLMPTGAIYRQLNEILFHGKIGRDLLLTFKFEGKHFVYPEDLLVDGLHPSPHFISQIWKCVVRTIIPPVPVNENPVPTLSKLSVRDRLSFSTSTLNQSYLKAPAVKGKGKGKRTTPYAAPFRVTPPQHLPYEKSYPAAYPLYDGGYWAAPPSYNATVPSAPPAEYYPSTSYQSPSYYNPPDTSSASHGPPEKLLEKTSDTHGNLSWRPLPAEPISELGTINYSLPYSWTWNAHHAEVKRVQGRCLTSSIAKQSLFRDKLADIIRERALDEARRGLNSTVNLAASALNHRSVNQMSNAQQGDPQLDHDLRGLIPPRCHEILIV
ncbi:unnamed protein product [Rotaria socialis]|uniref:Uncharacterized protein n=1 Tax=Rotaria socialis TaxID=392032 RepID=A0A821VUJ6_9BILA|nr:unnamed protein product [Rotaria socialis]CAF4911944.1 unnamed protein product [Rotaria socialis]